MTDATIPLIIDVLGNTRYEILISHINKQYYDKASNKRFLVELAKKKDIPHPKTTFFDKSFDLKKFAENQSFPVVIKPAKSIIIENDKVVASKVQYASNPKELQKKLQADRLCNNEYLIQEIIRGEGIGFFCLYQDGELKRIFCHKRILEKPPSGGVSVLCESIDVDHKC